MMITKNIALVPLILWQLCSCQGELCFIIPVQLDANKSKLVSVLGCLAVLENFISLVILSFAYSKLNQLR